MLELAKEYNFNMKYFDELKRSMEYLGKKKDTIFIGQAVEVAGTAMSNTLRGVSKNKLIELHKLVHFPNNTKCFNAKTP